MHNISYAAIKSDLKCARDHKWDLVKDTIERKECDCVTFFKVDRSHQQQSSSLFGDNPRLRYLNTRLSSRSIGYGVVKAPES